MPPRVHSPVWSTAAVVHLVLLILLSTVPNAAVHEGNGSLEQCGSVEMISVAGAVGQPSADRQSPNDEFGKTAEFLVSTDALSATAAVHEASLDANADRAQSTGPLPRFEDLLVSPVSVNVVRNLRWHVYEQLVVSVEERYPAFQDRLKIDFDPDAIIQYGLAGRAPLEFGVNNVSLAGALTEFVAQHHSEDVIWALEPAKDDTRTIWITNRDLARKKGFLMAAVYSGAPADPWADGQPLMPRTSGFPTRPANPRRFDWSQVISEATIRVELNRLADELEAELQKKPERMGRQVFRDHLFHAALLAGILFESRTESTWFRRPLIASHRFSELAQPFIKKGAPLQTTGPVALAELRKFLAGESLQAQRHKTSWWDDIDFTSIMSNLERRYQPDESAPPEQTRYDAENMAAIGQLLIRQRNPWGYEEEYTQECREFAAATLEMVRAARGTDWKAALNLHVHFVDHCAHCHQKYR